MSPRASSAEQRGARHDGEIAAAACELDERVAISGSRQRQRDAGEQFVRREARGQVADGELRKRNGPATARGNHVQRAAQERRHVDQFRGGIEVTQRAAEGAAVARLAVPDVGERLAQDRAAPADVRGEFEFALARHRARLQRSVRHAHVGELPDPVEVDQVIRRHGAEIHHRHQRLAAGKHARVLARREQIAGFGHGARIVVDERGGFHVKNAHSATESTEE